MYRKGYSTLRDWAKVPPVQSRHELPVYNDGDFPEMMDGNMHSGPALYGYNTQLDNHAPFEYNRPAPKSEYEGYIDHELVPNNSSQAPYEHIPHTRPPERPRYGAAPYMDQIGRAHV